MCCRTSLSKHFKQDDNHLDWWWESSSGLGWLWLILGTAGWLPRPGRGLRSWWRWGQDGENTLSTLPGTPSGTAAFLGFTARSLWHRAPVQWVEWCRNQVGVGLVQCRSQVEEGAGLEQMSAAVMFQSEQRSSSAPLPVAHSGLKFVIRSNSAVTR